MDQFDDTEISKLLRLKKYEQPPPGYFDSFLHEFHRRQRDELLRQPLWKICLQRAQDFMFRLNVPSLASYPVAAAALVLFAAVFSLKISQQPAGHANLAQSSPVISTNVNADGEWSLASPVATKVFTTQPLRKSIKSAFTHSRNSGTPPRYVLDSVPVSYESTFRF